jgi:hypothetical protein
MLKIRSHGNICLWVLSLWRLEGYYKVLAGIRLTVFAVRVVFKGI